MSPNPVLGSVSRQEIDEIVSNKNICTYFLETVRRNPTAISIRSRTLDETTGDQVWVETSWQELRDQVSAIAGGLARAGIGPGDRVVMMMRNIPKFHALDLAVLFLGATPISIYNSSSPDQIAYLAAHCNAKFAIVEGAPFLDRFLKARPLISSLEGLAVLDHTLADPGNSVIPFGEIEQGDPIDLDRAAEKVAPDVLATVIYTSGTTGPPKGVMLSHYTICWTVDSMSRLFGEDIVGKKIVSYLPMAHIAERMISHYQHVILGPLVVDCPDLAELPGYLGQVKPQLFLGVPRVWEKIYALIQSVVGTDPDKKSQFDQAIELGRKCSLAREDGRDLPADLVEVWNKLDGEVFRPIREMAGLDKVECALSGAAPIPREIFDFFRIIGLPLSEVYGLSECCGPLTWERFKVRSGTVGRALPGTRVELLDDGEVICQGGHVFPGYLNDPEKTREMLDDQGWLHTGDIGTIDSDGYLRIIDRKKELIITAGGKNISPANIEASLKSFPLIGQVCAIGDGRPFVSALLVLDPDVAMAWANQHGLTGATLESLSKDPAILAQVQTYVDESNKAFNSAEQVKKFVILPNEWMADSEELTPTMKLKRRGIHERYAREIESIYSG